MSWWGWLLVSPALVVLALVVLFVLVLVREIAADSGERTGRWLATRPGMADRMARRPVGGRVGVVLVTLGLIPFLVLLTGFLTGEEIRADSTLRNGLAGAATLITSGLVTLAIWWRLAADD